MFRGRRGRAIFLDVLVGRPGVFLLHHRQFQWFLEWSASERSNASLFGVKVRLQEPMRVVRDGESGGLIRFVAG